MRFAGDADRAFEWLQRAYTERDPALIEMKGDPLLKKITGDPRYTALLKKMRLPPSAYNDLAGAAYRLRTFWG